MSAGMSESSSSAERGMVTISGWGVSASGLISEGLESEVRGGAFLEDRCFEGSMNSEMALARAERELLKRDF